MSSQYSRYTTTKGQLLLNIKPPSNRNIKINTSNNNNNITSSPINQPKYIPYTGVNSNIDSRYQTGSFGLNINNQNTMAIKDQNGQSGYRGQNQRQIYYPQRNQVVNSTGLNQRGNSNIYYQQSNSRHQYNPQPVTTQPNYQVYNTIQPQPHHTQPAPPFVLNSQQNYAKTNVQNNQRPLSQTKTGKLGSINAFDQENINNKRQQSHKNQVDQTVCCFPGYWLLLLLLAVMVGCFVLITLRNQQGLFSVPNNSTDTFAAANGNGTNSTNVANNTDINSGQAGASGNTTGISGNNQSGTSSSSTSTTGTTGTNSGSGTSSTSGTSGSTNLSGGALNGTSSNNAGTSSTATTNAGTTSTTNLNTSFQFPTSGTPSTTTATSNTNTNTNTSPSSSSTTSFMFPPTTHYLQLRHQISSIQKQTKSHKLLPS